MKKTADASAALNAVMSKPPAPLFLKYENRESFFDRDVQEVLMRRHPSRWTSPTGDKHWPILAWSRVDQYARTCRISDANAADFHEALASDTAFTADLLAAVVRFRNSEADALKDPENTLAAIKRWRRSRYLDETSPVQPAPAPRGWLEGFKKRRGEEAYRQAVFKENKRRDQIWQLWSECWVAYFEAVRESTSAEEIPIDQPSPAASEIMRQAIEETAESIWSAGKK